MVDLNLIYLKMIQDPSIVNIPLAKAAVIADLKTIKDVAPVVPVVDNSQSLADDLTIKAHLDALKISERAQFEKDRRLPFEDLLVKAGA